MNFGITLEGAGYKAKLGRVVEAGRGRRPSYFLVEGTVQNVPAELREAGIKGSGQFFKLDSNGAIIDCIL